MPIPLPNGLKRGRDFRWVVRVVVENIDTTVAASVHQAALDALEAPQRLEDHAEVSAQSVGQRAGCQRIVDVVPAGHGQRCSTDRLPAPFDVKTCQPTLKVHARGAPCGARVKSEALEAPRCLLNGAM